MPSKPDLDTTTCLTPEQFVARFAMPAGTGDRPADFVLSKASANTASIAVLVRAPSDRWFDCFQQMVAHLKAGVRVVLLLDVPSSTAAVYRDDDARCVLRFHDTFTLPDVLPGFAVPVSRLFA